MPEAAANRARSANDRFESARLMWSSFLCSACREAALAGAASSAHLDTSPGGHPSRDLSVAQATRKRLSAALHYALILVSSAIISSRRSRSGTSGVSLTIRIWQMIGVRSGNTRELSGRTTSELTRTSCGKPWLTSAQLPPSTLVPSACSTTMCVRPLAGGIIWPQAPSKDTNGTALPFHGTVPMYHGGAPVISEGVWKP